MPAKKPSAAAVLAEKMLRALRQRREENVNAAPLSAAALAALVDPGAGPRTILAVLRQRKTFGALAVAAARDIAAPVALAADLPHLATSAQILEYALRRARTAANHALSLAELKKKLTGKLQGPFQEAVQKHTQLGTLPPTVGWLLIKNSRKFLLLSDLHTGCEPASGGLQPPAVEQPTGGLRPPLAEAFARAFDEAFARLDRQGGGYNFVSLAELRPALPCDRAAFDAGLHALRVAGRYTLSAAEGRHGLTAAEREAGVSEDGTLLLFVSRKAP
jgi:hypothetical protein